VSALQFENRFKTDPASGALELAFADLDLLKVLDMESVSEDAVSSIPEWMTSLDGQLVRIRGFMVPSYKDQGLTEFVLQRNWNTDFGFRPSKPYDIILVELQSGTTTDYVSISNSIDVIGRFKLDVQSDNGRVYQLYRIEDAKVVAH